MAVGGFQIRSAVFVLELFVVGENHKLIGRNRDRCQPALRLRDPVRPEVAELVLHEIEVVRLARFQFSQHDLPGEGAGRRDGPKFFCHREPKVERAEDFPQIVLERANEMA